MLAPSKGSSWTSGHTTRVSYVWIVPKLKIQRWSTTDPQPLRSPTPEAVARHVGPTWVTDSPEVREEAPADAPEIPPSKVLKYMGIDIYLQGTPTAPCSVPEVRASRMVLMAKL